MKWTICALAVLMLSIASFAQPAPGDGGQPPPPEGGGDQIGAPPGGPGRQDTPGRRFDGQGGRPDGPGGMGGPGMGRGPGQGPGGGPGTPGMPPQMMAMQRYLDLVNQYSKMSSDPQTSGVAAVIAASDILKPRGTDAAIQWFTKILPETKNPAVRRAIHGQLADLYKASGQQDKALEELHTLITEAGGSESAPANR